MILPMKNIYICASQATKKEFNSFLSELEGTFTVKDISDLGKDLDDESVVLVLGGDGTLNYMINNIEYIKKLRVLYIPSGTANDFARSLKIEPMILSVSMIENILENASLTKVPIMMCNERRFINVATAGAPAMVTDSGSDLIKRLAGKISYYISALEEMVSPKEFEIKYSSEKENEVKVKTLGFVVSQGMYAGGGVKVTSNFSPSFKKNFSFITFESKKISTYLPLFLKIQQRDFDNDLKESEFIQENLSSLRITSKEMIPIKLDGEEYEAKEIYFSKGKQEINFYLY